MGPGWWWGRAGRRGLPPGFGVGCGWAVVWAWRGRLGSWCRPRGGRGPAPGRRRASPTSSRNNGLGGGKEAGWRGGGGTGGEGGGVGLGGWEEEWVAVSVGDGR